MQLEDYFEFLASDDIRVKGTLVGIETILTDYLELGLFAEQIAARYPTLSVEQVYATLTYYWRNRVRQSRPLSAAIAAKSSASVGSRTYIRHRPLNGCGVGAPARPPARPGRGASMSPGCLLLDEHVPPFIQAQLARMAPTSRVCHR